MWEEIKLFPVILKPIIGTISEWINADSKIMTDNFSAVIYVLNPISRRLFTSFNLMTNEMGSSIPYIWI